jgi:hypothetical protein
MLGMLVSEMTHFGLPHAMRAGLPPSDSCLMTSILMIVMGRGGHSIGDEVGATPRWYWGIAREGLYCPWLFRLNDEGVYMQSQRWLPVHGAHAWEESYRMTGCGEWSGSSVRRRSERAIFWEEADSSSC